MSRFKAPFVTLMGRNLMGDHSVVHPRRCSCRSTGSFPAPGSCSSSSRWRSARARSPCSCYARRRLESRVAARRVRRRVPAPPGGLVDEHGELPSRRVPRAVRRLRHLRRARAQVAVYCVVVVLALLVKEDASLVIVAARRVGGAASATSAGSACSRSPRGVWASWSFAMFVVMRILIGVPTRNAWRDPVRRRAAA